LFGAGKVAQSGFPIGLLVKTAIAEDVDDENHERESK